MGKTPPAFQFYYKDFMDAVSMWDANAVGVYIRMLCTQYSQGGLPDNLDALERAVGKEVREVWHIVKEKFPVCKDGLRRNERLEEVREVQNEFRKSRQKAAKTRWGKRSKKSNRATAYASPSASPHEVHAEDEDRRGRVSISEKERAPARKGPNPDVQAVVDYLTNRLREEGIAQSLDGAQDRNRQAAYSLLGKMKKDYADKDPVTVVKALIDAALTDEFHRKNATQFAYLFNHCGKIIATFKNSKNGKPTLSQQIRAKYRHDLPAEENPGASDPQPADAT